MTDAGFGNTRTMTIREVENAWIPLADGTRLAARLWLPADAADDPVPAILEYLPYRKDDGTAGQDATRHPYFAEHGYAAVRVDIRGTGDSDGIITDEYTPQEQADALEVLSWIAAQPWCTGRIGMIGYSWGGFNGLQVAAHRPPELGAVVTAYSTDDRYADDCHYMGGCLLGSDMLKWATYMRGYNALPPDPRFRDDWREVWRMRLERTPAFIEPWVTHQVWDEYWVPGSVCRDFAAIETPTLVVGGWADAYTNAVPRLLEGLECPVRGIIGPWAHVLPYAGVPGPAIGFLAECVRWFDHWLKGVDRGVDEDPTLRAWIEEPVPPASYYAERPGRWVEAEWPPSAPHEMRFGLGDGIVDVASPQHTGLAAGVWCANGYEDELPVDQSADDAISACFDLEPLEREVESLGTPVVRLRLSADRPLALVAVRLCEVAENGESTLVSWGMLNLTHRDGRDRPQALEPGEYYDVDVALNVIGHRFARGARLRVAVSQAYWPHAWPSPEPVTLRIDADASELVLPGLDPSAAPMRRAFGPPEDGGGSVKLRDGERRRERMHDPETGLHRITDTQGGVTELANGTLYEARAVDTYEIREDDPLSARAVAHRVEALRRDGWDVRVECDAEMTATATEFVIEDRVTAFDAGELFFESQREYRIPRNGV